MHRHRRLLIILCLLLLLAVAAGRNASAGKTEPPVTDRLREILDLVSPRLESEMAAEGFQLGAPVFLRVFKLPGILEAWVKKNGRFGLFRTYPICDFSGYPGPKLREGDWQSPEGFYTVTAARMHPKSSYHLAFNIGYPNEFDQSLGRTGGNIMVHGDCSSRGCFAMGDHRMEEIYTLVHRALENGQETVDLHIFPFPLTPDNLARYDASPWIGFWRNLKQGYDAFEETRRVPVIRVTKGRYLVEERFELALGNAAGTATAPAAPRNPRYR
ncbi:MAG: hypothetical protein Kow0089_01210 [Desulfobulbaceae bacterium]